MRDELSFVQWAQNMSTIVFLVGGGGEAAAFKTDVAISEVNVADHQNFDCIFSQLSYNTSTPLVNVPSYLHPFSPNCKTPIVIIIH